MASCARCSRRTALTSLGALAVVSAFPGCVARSSLRDGQAASCTGGLCIDLSLDVNAPLRTVGGGVLIHTASDEIAVVRTSDTQVAAVSAICTHEGCLTNYDASGETLECPCHGSSFALTGAVLRGPASRPVRVYPATLSGTIVMLTGA